MAEERPKLTRQHWVDAARKVFVTSGVDDVKVDRLARRLKISRGSFYWHFESRRDLLDALLRDWETRNREQITAILQGWAANGAAEMSDVSRVWIETEPAVSAFDLAMRVWARKSRSVADAVKAVDDGWIHLIEQTFRQDGRTPRESFIRARVAYFHQIGYWTLDIVETLEDRLELAPIYHEAILGHPPNKTFMDMLDDVRARQARGRRGERKGRGRSGDAARAGDALGQ